MRLGLWYLGSMVRSVRPCTGARSLSLVSFVATAFALAVSGCGPRAGENPRSALDAYADALEEDRLTDAYALLSAETRAEISFDQFQELVRDNPKEVEALVAAARAEKHPPVVTAEFVTDAGEVLTLIYERGAWRIDESAVNLYDQSEPRVALASFVKAYDNDRYDLLLLFVPEKDSEGLTEDVLKSAWEGEQKLEMEQIVEGLRAHLTTGQLEVLGERATMSYGAGGVVELLREDGVWKIEDFQ